MTDSSVACLAAGLAGGAASFAVAGVRPSRSPHCGTDDGAARSGACRHRRVRDRRHADGDPRRDGPVATRDLATVMDTGLARALPGPGRRVLPAAVRRTAAGRAGTGPTTTAPSTQAGRRPLGHLRRHRHVRRHHVHRQRRGPGGALRPGAAPPTRRRRTTPAAGVRRTAELEGIASELARQPSLPGALRRRGHRAAACSPTSSTTTGRCRSGRRRRTARGLVVGSALDRRAGRPPTALGSPGRPGQSFGSRVRLIELMQ